MALGDGGTAMNRGSRPGNGLWVLFAVSSVVFLVVMAVSPVKDYFREYRVFQNEYHDFLLDRAGTAKELDAARSETVHVRQIWLPQLGGAVDRCMSCHLGVTNPQAASAESPLAFHPLTPHTPDDIDRFGCVSCHRGQGRAVRGGMFRRCGGKSSVSFQRGGYRFHDLGLFLNSFFQASRNSPSRPLLLMIAILGHPVSRKISISIRSFFRMGRDPSTTNMMPAPLSTGVNSSHSFLKSGLSLCDSQNALAMACSGPL